MEDSKRGLIMIIAINLIIIQTFANWDENLDTGYQEEEISIILEIDFGTYEPSEENIDLWLDLGFLDAEYVNGTWIFSVDYTTHYTNSWWVWTLASTEYNIRYTSTYYSGLGEMMESIDGIKSWTNANETSGRYWALYVNGNYAEAGASSTYLVNGDKMTWKLDAW